MAGTEEKMTIEMTKISSIVTIMVFLVTGVAYGAQQEAQHSYGFSPKTETRSASYMQAAVRLKTSRDDRRLGDEGEYYQGSSRPN